MNRNSLPPSSSLAELATLEGLLEKHRSRFLAIVRRRIDPRLEVRIDAEGILTDAYLLARRKWSAFQATANRTPYAWLYGIVRDCLIEAWRRHTRDKRNLHKDMPWPDRSSVQLAARLVNPATSPSQAAARGELQACMRQALGLLKDKDREILWMRHYDDLTFGEAGAVLNITANAATVRYVRALKRLKDLWLQRHPDLGATP